MFTEGILWKSRQQIKDYALNSIIDRLSKNIKECNDLSRRAEKALDKLNGVERRGK